jgi:hypothetical protein
LVGIENALIILKFHRRQSQTMSNHGTENHACVPNRRSASKPKCLPIIVGQYGVQARVPKTWDSRVAEAPAYHRQEIKFAGPVVFLDTGFFLKIFNPIKGGIEDDNSKTL